MSSSKQRQRLAVVLLTAATIDAAPAPAWSEGAGREPAPSVSTPSPARRPHRYAWGDNKWTTGMGATLISSGFTMAGGAGLAVLTEPRSDNETPSRPLHVIGLGVFGLSALSLVMSPISSATKVAKKPDAPLAPAPFFVGGGAIALGGAAVSVGMLATLGDEHDSPWDDARGVAIASGAALAAFGVTLVLIGATDSGVEGARRPWQPIKLPPQGSASLRLGAGSAFIDGRF